MCLVYTVFIQYKDPAMQKCTERLIFDNVLFYFIFFILTNLFGSNYYNISSLSRNKNNRLYTNNWIAILYRYIYIYIYI
jgi:hypothetical protein